MQFLGALVATNTCSMPRMHDSLHPVCRCPQPEQSTTSLRGELEETQNTPFDTTSAFASYSTRTDALSVSHRHFKEVMKDWALRARCARALGAFPADGASSISYNHLGVCLSAATFDRNATSLVDAARALLSSGMPSDCAAADAVIKQLARAPSRAEEPLWRQRPDGRLRNLTADGRTFHDQLAAQGYALIPPSWGLGALLENDQLASRLRSILDKRQAQAADGSPCNKCGAFGNRPTAYRKRWLPWEHDGHILPRDRAGWYSDSAWRNVTAAMASRLRPAVHAYIGRGAVSGMCRVLILPARNLTPIEYPSGLWHHDRCGRRIKCFVFLEDVRRESHPMLLVPASHRTVYYSYSLFGASRFSDAHVAAHHKAPRAMLGAPGEGYCFDTNGIHRGTLDGARARYSIVVEFHDELLEQEFREAHVPRPPFGE